MPKKPTPTKPISKHFDTNPPQVNLVSKLLGDCYTLTNRSTKRLARLKHAWTMNLLNTHYPNK